MKTAKNGVSFTINLVDPSTAYFEIDPACDDVPVFVSSFGRGWKTHALLDGVWVVDIHNDLDRALEDAARNTRYLRSNIGRTPKSRAARGI